MSQEIYSLATTVFNVFKAGERNPEKVKRMLHGQATSDEDGVATLYVTENGLADGNPLFTTIDYAVASIYSTNSSISERPRV